MEQVLTVLVDLKEAYNSIDRAILIGVQDEYGVINKTRNLVNQALNNTKIKIWVREIPETFEIKTG